MRITFFKILIILIIILIFGLYGIFISGKLSRETGYFVLPISTGMSALVASAIIFSLLYKFKSEKEKAFEREEVIKPLDELQSMLYKIQEIEKSGKSLKGKAYSIAKSVLPSVSKIIKDYPDFLHQLPKEYSRPFFEIHYSALARKHGHYFEKRLIQDVRKLEKSIHAILKKYR